MSQQSTIRVYMGNKINKAKKTTTLFTEIKQDDETLQHLFDAFKYNKSEDALKIVELIKNKMIPFNRASVFKQSIKLKKNYHSFSHYYNKFYYISYIKSTLQHAQLDVENFIKGRWVKINNIKPVWLALLFSMYDQLGVNVREPMYSSWTKVFEELVELSDYTLNDKLLGHPVSSYIAHKDIPIAYPKWSPSVVINDCTLLPFNKIYEKVLANCIDMDFYDFYVMASKNKNYEILKNIPLDMLINQLDKDKNTLLHTTCYYSDGSAESVNSITRILEVAKEKDVNIITAVF